MKITEQFSEYMGALFVNGAIQAAGSERKLAGNQEAITKAVNTRYGHIDSARKAALTSSDAPMPVEYSSELADLIPQYGVARRFATVFPISTASAKLPRVKTRPAMGFIDGSEALPEVSPQTEYVTATPKKAGGMVRLPNEMATDLKEMGAWLIKYGAKELARLEDNTLFNADGGSDYKGLTGVCVAANALSKVHQLTSTNTRPSNMALTDLRTVRTKVDVGAKQYAAYYLHPTHESFLLGLNSAVDKVFVPDSQNPRLDGYPVRWVHCLPEYNSTAAANQFQVAFGDLSYWWFVQRGGFEVKSSSKAAGLWENDETGVALLERFSVNLLADGAMAVIKLAAS